MALPSGRAPATVGTIGGLLRPLLERVRGLRAWAARDAVTPRSEAERLADFLRAAADFVWETDRELRLVFLSEPAAAILGRPVASLLGLRWPELACDPANRGGEPGEPMPPLPGAAGFELGTPFRDRRCTLLGRDGRLLTLETSGVPLIDRHGRLAGYRGIAREVSERAHAEQRLRFLAGHDPLTGAANRARLAAALDRAVERAARSGRLVGLVVVDLDGFKQVNDALGHAAGDAVLRAVVRRLREGTGERDLVARLGGDEFALLLGELERPADLAARAEAAARRLEEPLTVEGVGLTLGASCGTAVWPDDAGDLDGLLRRADAAMYRAKRARRAAPSEDSRRPQSLPTPG